MPVRYRQLARVVFSVLADQLLPAAEVLNTKKNLKQIRKNTYHCRFTKKVTSDRPIIHCTTSGIKTKRAAGQEEYIKSSAPDAIKRACATQMKTNHSFIWVKVYFNWITISFNAKMLNNLFLQRFLTTRKKGKKQEINLCLPVKGCVETGLLTIDEEKKRGCY